MHRYVYVWYQVESLCREVASLRTTLQSKHRQFQEFMSNHERAQRFHQWWEKVRFRERKFDISGTSVVHREARTTKVIARHTNLHRVLFFYCLLLFFYIYFYFSLCLDRVELLCARKTYGSLSVQRENVQFQTDDGADGAGSDGSLPESWSSLNDDKCVDAMRELVNHHVSKSNTNAHWPF